jgi:hypothetical protein
VKTVPPKDVVADWPLEVGWVEVNELVGAVRGDKGERLLGEIAMGIEQDETAPHAEVLADEVEE